MDFRDHLACRQILNTARQERDRAAHYVRRCKPADRRLAAAELGAATIRVAELETLLIAAGVAGVK